MNPAFRRKDPLTMRTARTLRELDDNPLDWWEGHDPEFSPPATRLSKWLLVLTVIAGVSLVATVALIRAGVQP